MNKNMHLIRSSTFEEIIERNKKKPAVLQRIISNINEVLAILMNGVSHSNIEGYCRVSQRKTVSKSIFYDYLHFIEPVLRILAETICNENFSITKTKQFIKIGFDGCWAHRRNANQSLGILMDLESKKIVSFHITHHGKEFNYSLTPTNLNSKCMERINLLKIIEKTNISDLDNIIFVHDCDLTDEYLLNEQLKKAKILYDPNHYSKKNRKIINKSLSKRKNLKQVSEKVQKFYNILIHEQEISLEDKKAKWKNTTKFITQFQKWTEENNKEDIEEIEKLINDLTDTFDKVDPALSTNSIESFNHLRALMANKNVAWRISWRIRCYISIIKWNADNWQEQILKCFMINPPPDVLIYQVKEKIAKEIRIAKTTTKEYKKEHAIKRRKRKSLYKLGPKDLQVHPYADDEIFLNKTQRKNQNSYHGWIFEALFSLSTEDKQYISFTRIKNYIFQYFATNDNKITEKKIQTQLTRLTNQNRIRKKKSSYALIDNYQIIK